MRDKAIQRLISNWKSLVERGEFDAQEMRLSLEEQVSGDCQGWDASLEELEIDPELREIMGYGEDLTPEQEQGWCGVVVEAARKYLEDVRKYLEEVRS